MAIGGGGGGTGKFLGLGFLFGAKDKGAVKVSTEIGESFDTLSDNVKSVGNRTSGLLKFGNAINALNFLQVNRLADSMKGLAEKAGIGTAAQTTQLESWGIQFGKSYREATAGLGDFRKQVDAYKGAISGVSFTLEVDAAEMTKAITLITKSGYKLEEYGLSVREVGGLMQSGILSGEQLADVLTSLAKGYGLGAEGAGKLMDSITAIGKKTGMGAQAIQVMPEALKAADAAIAGLPEGMTSNVDDMIKSMTILAASTQKVLGGPYQDAFQAATDVMQTLTESRQQMAQTFTGLQSDFPSLVSRLTEGTNDIDKAFEMMASDPATFVQEIQKVYGTLDETRKFRLLEQLPDSIKFMVKAGAEGAKVIEELKGPIEGTSGALGEMAKKASGSTRSFADRMELLKDRYETQLRGMTSVTRREVYQRTRAMYDKLGDKMKEMSKDKGALGVFTRAWLNVRQFGFVQGIIPVLEEFTERKDYLGKITTKIRDSLPMLEEWGGALFEAGKAIAPVAIGIYALGKAAGAILPSWGTLKTLMVGKGTGLGGLLGMLKTGLLGLFTPFGLIAAAAAAAGVVIYKNWDIIGPALKVVWKIVKEELGPTFEWLWDGMKEGIGFVWNELLVPFGKWFRAELPGWIAGGVSNIMSLFYSLKFVAQTVFTGIVGGWKLIGNFIKYVGTLLDQYVISYFKDASAAFGDFFRDWSIGWLQIKRLTVSDTIEIDKQIKNLRDEQLRYDMEYSEESKKRREEEKKNTLQAWEDMVKGAESTMADWEKNREDLEKGMLKTEAGKLEAEIRARVVKEEPKEEEKVRRRGRRRRVKERTPEDMAAARAKATAEAGGFMVRSKGGATAEPLESFMKKQAFSREGVKQLTEAFRDGALEADRKKTRGARGSAPDGAEVI